MKNTNGGMAMEYKRKSKGRKASSVRRPTGKISKLPVETRLWVNELLHNGENLSKVQRDLAAKGHVMSPGAVHSWFHSGYQLWLKDRTRIDEARVEAEATCNLVRQLKADGETEFADVNELILASRIHEVIREFDTKALRKMLQDKPESFFNLARVITAQSAEQTRRQKSELDLQKYRDLVAEQKVKISAITKKSKNQGGLSETTLKQIDEALHLL